MFLQYQLRNLDQIRHRVRQDRPNVGLHLTDKQTKHNGHTHTGKQDTTDISVVSCLSIRRSLTLTRHTAGVYVTHLKTRLLQLCPGCSAVLNV